MTTDQGPCTVSPACGGDAAPETLAGLVNSSRRMSFFWPVSAAEPLPPQRPAPGFTVPPSAASLVAGMAEYGD